MPLTTLLLSVLKTEFPQFTFRPAERAYWQPENMTIYYHPDSYAELLHELAHAVLGHTSYYRDVELIGMERDAWEYATSLLAPAYNLTIDDDTIETALDSYREWLHNRSLCPACNATGIQSSRKTYRCLACQTSWRVNEAKTCSLRRYKINPH